MTLRSWLYVPAVAGRRLGGASARGAGRLILDLEDAIASDQKNAARAAACDYLANGGTAWVRINGGDLGLADARAVVAAGAAGLCLPKVESAAEVEVVAEAVDAAEASARLPAGSIPLGPLLESAAGLFAAEAIARAPRVAMLHMGEVDLAADLGVTPSPDGLELLMARSTVVMASRAAGIESPPAAVSPEFVNLEAFRDETIRLRRLGFYGRVCIHPAQLAVVEEAFSATDGERAWAESVLSACRAALAAGSGVATDASGQLVDLATVRRAERLLN